MKFNHHPLLIRHSPPPNDNWGDVWEDPPENHDQILDLIEDLEEDLGLSQDQMSILSGRLQTMWQNISVGNPEVITYQNQKKLSKATCNDGSGNEVSPGLVIKTRLDDYVKCTCNVIYEWQNVTR